MRTIVIKDRIVIPLGRIGDNEATTIKFNIASFFPGLSGAQYELVHKRPNDANAYPVLQKENGRVRDGFINWVVKSSDLGTVAGNGVAQLSAYVGDTRVKSVVFTTQIANGMGFGPKPDDPEDPWVDNVLEAGAAAVSSASTAAAEADRAAEAAAGAEALVASVPATVNAALAEAKASGEFDGADGFSPIVTVTDIDGGHRVTITDVDGDHVFDVMDGEDGSGGGGGGTTNYNNLTNKPKINGYTLSGERTAAGLDLAQALWVDDYTTTEDLYDAWVEGRYIARKDSGRVYTLAYRYDHGGSVYYVFTCLEDDGAWYVWKRDNAGNWGTVTQYSPPQGAVTGTPAMDGTASRGLSEYYAREDHVHPADTSRAPAAAGVPAGGNAGAVLMKSSSQDYDAEWGSIVYTFPVYYISEWDGTVVSSISVAGLLEKINSPVVYAGVDNGRIPLYSYSYSTSQGVTSWDFVFAGAGLYNGDPCIVLIEFLNQPAAATELTGVVSRFAVGGLL